MQVSRDARLGLTLGPRREAPSVSKCGGADSAYRNCRVGRDSRSVRRRRRPQRVHVPLDRRVRRGGVHLVCARHRRRRRAAAERRGRLLHPAGVHGDRWTHGQSRQGARHAGPGPSRPARERARVGGDRSPRVPPRPRSLAREARDVARVGRILCVLPGRPQDRRDVPPGASRDVDHRRSAARARADAADRLVLVEAGPLPRPAAGSGPARPSLVDLDGRGRGRRAGRGRDPRPDAEEICPRGWCDRSSRGRARTAAVVRASGDALLEPRLRPPAGGSVRAPAPAARVLRRRRLSGHRLPPVAGASERSLHRRSLLRDVGRLLRHLGLGSRPWRPNRCDRRVARAAESARDPSDGDRARGTRRLARTRHRPTARGHRPSRGRAASDRGDGFGPLPRRRLPDERR